jgi:hypothetical protein
MGRRSSTASAAKLRTVLGRLMLRQPGSDHSIWTCLGIPVTAVARGGGATSTYLSLPLPLLGLSLPRPAALSSPRLSPSWLAFPSRWSARSADSTRRLAEEPLPSAESAELTAGEAGGWLLGGLAANTAARSRPRATAALLVSVFSRIRARATPRAAPSSAAIATRSWPRRRSDRSTGPPRSNEPALHCQSRMRPNPTTAHPSWPLDASTELTGRTGILVAWGVTFARPPSLLASRRAVDALSAAAPTGPAAALVAGPEGIGHPARLRFMRPGPVSNRGGRGEGACRMPSLLEEDHQVPGGPT